MFLKVKKPPAPFVNIFSASFSFFFLNVPVNFFFSTRWLVKVIQSMLLAEVTVSFSFVTLLLRETYVYLAVFPYLSAVSLKAYIRMSIHDSSRQGAIPTKTAFASANFSPIPQALALRLPSDVESFLGLSSPSVWCCCWLYESSTVFLVPNYVRPCVSLTFRSSQYRKFAGRIYYGCPAGNLRTFFFGLFVLFLAFWEPVRFH